MGAGARDTAGACRVEGGMTISFSMVVSAAVRVVGERDPKDSCPRSSPAPSPSRGGALPVNSVSASSVLALSGVEECGVAPPSHASTNTLGHD